MSIYQDIIFTIFFIIIAMIIIDENVGIYIILKIKLIKINLERLLWIIRFHPKNPISNWLISRRSRKLAETLQKEYGLISEEKYGGNFKNKEL